MQQPLLSGSLSFNFDLPFSLSFNFWTGLIAILIVGGVAYWLESRRKNKHK